MPVLKIKIDFNNIIFENCDDQQQVEKSKAYFSQIPGSLNVSRVTRAIKEYSKYFILEILFILILLYVLIASFKS